jgi:hypothetical protein
MVCWENISGLHVTSENSIYSKYHVWITFQAHFKNEHALLPSLKIHFPITCKAILEHVWITFQAYFKKKHAVSPSLKVLFPIT